MRLQILPTDSPSAVVALSSHREGPRVYVTLHVDSDGQPASLTAEQTWDLIFALTQALTDGEEP